MTPPDATHHLSYAQVLMALAAEGAQARAAGVGVGRHPPFVSFVAGVAAALAATYFSIDAS